MQPDLEACFTEQTIERVYTLRLLRVVSRVSTRDSPDAFVSVVGENLATGVTVKYEQAFDEEDDIRQERLDSWAERRVEYAFADSRLLASAAPEACKHGHLTVGYDEDRNVVRWVFCSGCGIEFSSTLPHGKPVFEEGLPVISERFKPEVA